MEHLHIDHIVLIVKDIERTTHFYSSFLGDPLEISNDQVAYQIGDTKLFFGLPYSGYSHYDKDGIGLNHLAFGVHTLDELKECETLLSTKGIKNSDITIDPFGNKEFIWFDDPDGYRLEFYCCPE